MPATYDAVQNYMSIFDMWRLAMWHMAAAYEVTVEDARHSSCSANTHWHTQAPLAAGPGHTHSDTP